MNEVTYKEALGLTDSEFDKMGAIGADHYQSGNFDKAKTIFSGLVEIDPDNAKARAALGAVLTLCQQEKEAVIHLERAIKLDPESIAPYVTLAEIRIKMQRLTEAVELLETAILLDPHSSDPSAHRARMLGAAIRKVIEVENRRV